MYGRLVWSGGNPAAADLVQLNAGVHHAVVGVQPAGKVDCVGRVRGVVPASGVEPVPATRHHTIIIINNN